MKTTLVWACAFATVALGAVCWSAEPARSVDLTVQKWHGNAISYSGYRAGQNPQLGRYPTQAQILEDFKILERNWKLIRLYGSDQHSQDVLEVIRRERIGLKVMLGIWLDGRAGREGENATQIGTGIRLANTYKDIVMAVSVGNEILVFWSDHKLTEERTIEYVRAGQEGGELPGHGRRRRSVLAAAGGEAGQRGGFHHHACVPDVGPRGHRHGHAVDDQTL